MSRPFGLNRQYSPVLTSTRYVVSQKVLHEAADRRQYEVLCGLLQPVPELPSSPRDGNKILQRVADLVAGNYLNPGSTPRHLITAMTQLAVTGSKAFAAWSAAPTQNLTAYLTQKGMPAAAAATANQQIMSDFTAALRAVRSPNAGLNETSLRQRLKNNWIAVSGEDDPPDYPVNVDIAQYPQYHLAVTVPTPQGVNSSTNLSIRYVIASQASQGTTVVPEKPSIPPGDEIVLFIHGEGSRAEEAADFIPALFSVGQAIIEEVVRVLRGRFWLPDEDLAEAREQMNAIARKVTHLTEAFRSLHLVGSLN